MACRAFVLSSGLRDRAKRLVASIRAWRAGGGAVAPREPSDQAAWCAIALGEHLLHELSLSLNLLRHLVERGAGGVGMAGEDVELGRMEVVRLERIVNRLRALRVPVAQPRRVALRAALEPAFTGLRRPWTISSDGESEVVVDIGHLTQLLALLVRTAAALADAGEPLVLRQHAGGGWVRVDLSFRRTEPAWSVAADPFDPWACLADCPEGAMPVCGLLARSLAGRLDVEHDGRTLSLRLVLPAAPPRSTASAPLVYPALPGGPHEDPHRR